MSSVSLTALEGFPLIAPGDDLAALIAVGLERQCIKLHSDDVLVIAQKVVSKAEGRYVALDSVTPSAEAQRLAQQAAKDPRQMELVLQASRRVLKVKPGVVIAEHQLGFVLANAGIDKSNIEQSSGREQVLLLPENPDASARALRQALAERLGVSPAIVISDSWGRPWRCGSIGVAIGCAGMPAVDDQRGDKDLLGNTLEVTEVALADEIASAASLLQGQGAQGMPVVLVRGLALPTGCCERGAQALLRDPAQDLFRE